MIDIKGALYTVAGAVMLLMLAVAPASSQSAIPSFGSGTCEIVVFTDYFCPPCKRVDARAESLVNDLLKTGAIRITFVDVPFNRATPMYARYYLYAVNAGASASQILHVRRILFEAAQDKHILTEDALVVYLHKNKIDLKSVDEKPVFSLLSGAIKSARIDRTPTWLIRCPSGDEKRYIGEEQIMNGLKELKKQLKAQKK